MPGAVFGTCERLLLLLLCVETQREQIFATEEPGELRSMGSMGTRLSDFTFTFHFHALEKEMATHSSVLAWRISGTGSLEGSRLWGRTESDMTEAT